MLKQFLHVTQRSDPGAVQGDLLVDQQLRDSEGNLPALADESTAAPRPGVLQSKNSGDAAARTVDARLATATTGHFSDRGSGGVVGRQRMIDKVEVLGHLASLGGDIGGDDGTSTQGSTEHGRGQPNRP